MAKVPRIKLTVADDDNHLFKLPNPAIRKISAQEQATWVKYQEHVINFFHDPRHPPLAVGNDTWQIDCNRTQLRIHKQYFDPVCFDFNLKLPAHEEVSYRAYHSTHGAVGFFLQVAHAIACTNYDEELHKERKEAGYIHILKLHDALLAAEDIRLIHCTWQEVINVLCSNLKFMEYIDFRTVLVKQSTTQDHKKYDAQRACYMQAHLPERIVKELTPIELDGKPTGYYSYCAAEVDFLDSFGMYVTPDGFKMLQVLIAMEQQLHTESTIAQEVECEWPVIEFHSDYQDEIANLDVATWDEFKSMLDFDNPLVEIIYRAIEESNKSIPTIVYLLLLWKNTEGEKRKRVVEALQDIYHTWLEQEVLGILQGQVALGETAKGAVIAGTLPSDVYDEVCLFNGDYGEYLTTKAFDWLIYGSWEEYEVEGLTTVRAWLRNHMAQWHIGYVLAVSEIESLGNRAMFFRVYQQVGSILPELKTPHPFGTMTNKEYLEQQWNTFLKNAHNSIIRSGLIGTFKVVLSFYRMHDLKPLDVVDLDNQTQYLVSVRTTHTMWETFTGTVSYEQE